MGGAARKLLDRYLSVESAEKRCSSAFYETSYFITMADDILSQRQTILSQIVSDSLDVWIPATGLGYTNLNDGTLGTFG